jgi:hypothetical protein
MRQRGELLLIIDADQCPRLTSGIAQRRHGRNRRRQRPYIAATGGMGRSAPGASGAVPAAPMASAGGQSTRSGPSGRAY